MTRPPGPDQPQPRKQSRRERIVAEIQANRRGEFAVPTWVLAAALALMIAVICGVLLIF